MATKKNTRTARTLATNRGIAGHERAEALAKGGQQAQIWRGGGIKHTVTTDRRKKASRDACRGPVRW